MSASDLAQRGEAIPFLAQVFGYNRNEQSDYDISLATELGDLKYLANGSGTPPAKDNMIRILKPAFGDITQCYLNMSLTTSSSEPTPQFRISVSTTTSDADLTPVVPSDATITQQMIKIAGSTKYFAANNGRAGEAITLVNLNLLPILPKPTDADFRRDVIVIGVHFPQTPLNTSPYKLRRFQVDMSALILGG